MIRGRQIQGARSPWRLKIFTWRLNFQIQIHGFLSLYLQKKKNMLAPELFLVLSTLDYDYVAQIIIIITTIVLLGKQWNAATHTTVKERSILSYTSGSTMGYGRNWFGTLDSNGLWY
jgi:hypothetical protein